MEERAKGNRGKAAFASANEIAPAIGACLLAFDVRLVKCTGCDPPFEESTAPPITGSWTVPPWFLQPASASEICRGRASNRHVASSLFLRESCASPRRPRAYLVITLTTYILLLPVVLA